MFALPRAFTLWALVISSLQPLVIALGLPLAAICTGSAVGFCFLCVLCARIAPKLSPSAFRRRFRLFRARRRQPVNEKV